MSLHKISNLFLLLPFFIVGCTLQPEAAVNPPTATTVPAATVAQAAAVPATPTLDIGGLTTPTPEAFPSPTPEGGPVDLSALAIPQETTPQQITLTTEDDVALQGTYYPPIEDEAPVLLLLHMLNSNRQVWNEFAQVAQGDGYAVLAIDLRGHGESEGQRTFEQMDLDVTTALNWVRNQDKITPDRIAVIGASIGANLALRGGTNHADNVKAVILLSPGLDYRGITTDDVVAAYGERALLIIAAEGDSYSANSAQELHTLADEVAELQIFEGSAHGTNLFGTGLELRPRLFEWLSENL